MNTNENIRNDTTEEVIVLGVASIETQGNTDSGEVFGISAGVGISED